MLYAARYGPALHGAARSRTCGRCSRPARWRAADARRPRRASSTVRRCPILRSAPFAAAHELLVTTYDRDRSLGVLYRIVDGRAETGGRRHARARRRRPLLKQPEGVALDPAGNLYVADRRRTRSCSSTPRDACSIPVALADSPASHRQPRRAVLGLERRRRRGAVAARHRRDLERGPGGPPARPPWADRVRHGRQPGRTPVRRGPPERAPGRRGRRRRRRRSSPRSPTVTRRGTDRSRRSPRPRAGPASPATCS